MPRTSRVLLLALLPILVLTACTHKLEIINRKEIPSPDELEGPDEQTTIGLTSVSGDTDTRWFHDQLRQRLSSLENVDEVIQDYSLERIDPVNNQKNKKVDLVISLTPRVNYRSSPLNWVPINWPGFLIFTPGWNGYTYYADITTDYSVKDSNGDVISESTLRTVYDIRQADFDRSIWAEMGFFDGGILFSNVTGIYYARYVDPDIYEDFREDVRDHYVNHVISRLGFQPPEQETQEEPPEPEPSFNLPEQEGPTLRRSEPEPPQQEEPSLREPETLPPEPSPSPDFDEPKIRRGQ